MWQEVSDPGQLAKLSDEKTTMIFSNFQKIILPA